METKGDDKDVERRGLLDDSEATEHITTVSIEEAATAGGTPISPTIFAEEPNGDDEDEEDEDMDYQAETVLTILKPVTITMILVIWAVRSIQIPQNSTTGSIYQVYAESEGDSTSSKFFGSILNALMFLLAIVLSTIAMVALYKFRCYKAIYAWLILSSISMLAMFGGTFFYYFLQANNWPFDMISFWFLLWNFSMVGILAIFWHAPAKINQGYLIIVSALLAIFFTRLPDWTTFAILAIVSLYDLVAVLCPFGPLKILVETAQQRQEPIPALLYNASVYMFMADTPDPPPKKKRGVKLGLGDFIFYSVLIGRAALFNMLTVFTTFIGIVTGLFLTLLLLAIFRKALPALPISIFLGMIFYFLSRQFLLPFVIATGSHQIFV